jgi:hypothetical protein
MDTRPRLSHSVQEGDKWTNKETESHTKHAADLLKTVLASNAVTFGDDRRTQYWMGQYYIDNAAYRLDYYFTRWCKEGAPQHVEQFLSMWRGEIVPSDYASTAFVWMVIFEPFIFYVEELLAEIGAKPVVSVLPLVSSEYKFVPRAATLEDFFVDAKLAVVQTSDGIDK